MFPRAYGNHHWLHGHTSPFWGWGWCATIVGSDPDESNERPIFQYFKALVEAFAPIRIEDWNSLFWIAHPGGPGILDQVEAKLGLQESKLRVTRHVLSEFRNMWSACMIFILDEMRKRSLKEGKTTTGYGLDWGVLFGFGPGLTVETVVLHSVPLTD